MKAFAAIGALEAQIPADWKITPLKRVARLREDQNVDGDAGLLSLRNTGLLTPRSDDVQPPSADYVPRYWLVDPGDLVVNPMWLAGGAIGVSGRSGAVSPDYRVYALSSALVPRYVHHLVRSASYNDQYRLLMRAETTFDRRVTKEDFSGLPLLVPPTALQRRVADFLDAETARIDNVLAAREREAALVIERLARFVTGLYESLAERHPVWPLRHLLLSLRQGWSPQCENRPGAPGEWVVLKAGAVNGGVFRPGEHKALPPDLPPRQEFRVGEGDILMSRASGSLTYIGSVAVVDQEPKLATLYSDKLYKLVPDARRVQPRYLVAMLSAEPVRSAIQVNVSGAEGMANSIPSEVVRNLRLPLPEREEQQATVREVELRQALAARSLDVIDRQIRLLHEHRQALITAAVTGQLDRLESV